MPAASRPSDAALQQFVIDQAHSAVRFDVSKLGVSQIEGCFRTFEGSLHFDPKDLTTLHCHIDIDAASVDTGTSSRDDQVRGADFLSAEQHPTLSFEGTEVRELDVNAFELAGILTVRDVTRPIVLETTFLGLAHDQDDRQRASFYAQSTFDRTDFNVEGGHVFELGGLLAGHAVHLTIDLQAVEHRLHGSNDG